MFNVTFLLYVVVLYMIYSGNLHISYLYDKNNKLNTLNLSWFLVIFVLVVFIATSILL